MIIYSKSSGVNNAAIGKLENPIKMIIEHESDLITKNSCFLHIVSRKEDCASGCFAVQDKLMNVFHRHRIKSTGRFIEK